MQRTVEERFWEKVDKSGFCWEWTGAKIPAGYGMFWYAQRRHLAHRVSYILNVEWIPDGMVIHHACRNRLCVRPSHLMLVTPKENAARGVETHNGRKTHCQHGHEFTPENTGVFDGKRYCKTCRRRWGKETRVRRKERPPTERGVAGRPALRRCTDEDC